MSETPAAQTDVPAGREDAAADGTNEEGPLASMRKWQTLLHQSVHRTSSFVVKGNSNLPPDVATMRTKVQTFNSVIRTEDHLTLDHMETLMNVFFEHGGTLKEDEFKKALAGILGPSERFRRQMGQLFQKMDTRGTGEIDWDEFCTYMMQDLQDKEYLGNERELFSTAHRGAIRSILLIPNPSRFLTASDDGVLCFWNMKMACTRTIHLGAKQKSIRVSDVTYMSNAFRIVVATVNRDLCFYDSATAALCNRVVGLSDIATSIDYHVDPHDNDRSWLVFGDMGGSVNLLLFTSASTQLFNPPINAWQDGLNIHLSTIEATPKGITAPSVVKYFRFRTHIASEDEVDRSVKMIRVVPALDAIISCAATAQHSLAMRGLERHDDGSHFAVPKGVVSFDFSERWNLIATGGGDCHVRLWNPYVPTHPTALLKGHATPIAHVSFSPEYGQVFSLALNEVIKIWDIKDQICLNTLTSIIPHHPTHGRQLITAMLWHEASQSILTGCRDELSVVQMNRDERTKASQTSHEQPICAMVFVPELNRIVSADPSGVVISWDVATGQKLLQFSDTHGGASLTAMCRGYNGKRVITGERIFAVGWDRLLTSFKDDPINSIAECPIIVQEDAEWKPITSHSDDVTALDFCPDHMLATGSFDGRIIVWNLRSGRVINKFDSRTANRSDPSTAVARPQQVVRVAVDKLLWLRHRAHDSQNSKAATLVSSSDSGMINFWNVFKGHLMGSFHAAFADHGSQTIPALATDSKNSILFTGDSLGYIKIWNIDDVCTGLFGSRDGKPRQVASWRAHVQSVNSLIYIESSRLIVTGSADCSVRVWSAAGHFVGTFSASSAWVLASEPTGSSFTLGIAYNPDADRQEAASEIPVPRMSTLSLDEAARVAHDLDRPTSAATTLDGRDPRDLPRPDTAAGRLTVDDGTAEDRRVLSSRSDSALGSSLSRRLEQRLGQKVAWRATLTKPDFNKAARPGFLFCQPFQALSCSEMENIVVPNEPVSAARARSQRAALWEDEDERKSPTKGRRREQEGPLLPPLLTKVLPSTREKPHSPVFHS